MAIHPIMIPSARTALDLQPLAKGPSATTAVPLHKAANGLDIPEVDKGQGSSKLSTRAAETSRPRVELGRRDSLKRREALLRGNEGSRQRRRWENDRLLNNPWAQPPLPMDWEIHPTYPRHAVPYFLAPLWDAEAFERSIERKMKGKKQGKRAGTSPAEEAASKVPKEVRSKLKQARAAKGLLQDLEEDVRNFLQEWNEKEAKRRELGLDDIDSEEEEIVFVGRSGHMHDSPTRNGASEGPGRDKLVFHGLASDRGASFGRWLVHSIATYYGLRTWSSTTGDPARRGAYVGLGDKTCTLLSDPKGELPRPLWDVV